MQDIHAIHNIAHIAARGQCLNMSSCTDEARHLLVKNRQMSADGKAIADEIIRGAQVGDKITLGMWYTKSCDAAMTAKRISDMDRIIEHELRHPNRWSRTGVTEMLTKYKILWDDVNTETQSNPILRLGYQELQATSQRQRTYIQKTKLKARAYMYCHDRDVPTEQTVYISPWCDDNEYIRTLSNINKSETIRIANTASYDILITGPYTENISASELMGARAYGTYIVLPKMDTRLLGSCIRVFDTSPDMKSTETSIRRKYRNMALPTEPYAYTFRLLAELGEDEATTFHTLNLQCAH